MITIEKISNGWVVTENGFQKAFLDIRSLFEHLLLVLDGRASTFGGSMYGKITIETKEKWK